MKSQSLLWGAAGASAVTRVGAAPQDTPALPAAGQMCWGQRQRPRFEIEHFSALHTALVPEAPGSPQNHHCPQPVPFTEISFLLVELELTK